MERQHVLLVIDLDLNTSSADILARLQNFIECGNSDFSLICRMPHMPVEFLRVPSLASYTASQREQAYAKLQWLSLLLAGKTKLKAVIAINNRVYLSRLAKQLKVNCVVLVSNQGDRCIEMRKIQSHPIINLKIADIKKSLHSYLNKEHWFDFLFMGEKHP